MGLDLSHAACRLTGQIIDKHVFVRFPLLMIVRFVFVFVLILFCISPVQAAGWPACGDPTRL